MIALAVCLALTQPDPFAPRSVAFSHVPPDATTSVAVVGAFNQWDRAALPLRLQADRRTWWGSFEIAPGVYPYLFVENGNKWTADPKAPPFPDANGNTNSKLVVEPLDYDTQPGKAGDGLITSSPLRHRPDRADTVRLDRDWAWVKLRTRRSDVARAFVGFQNGTETRMELAERDELFDTWMSRFRFSPKAYSIYGFRLEDGGKHYWYDPRGSRALPAAGYVKDYFSQAIKSYALPSPPTWVQDAVFYQIFPERFENGDASNDPRFVEPWGAKPTGRNRMGGDLAGIRKRLGHLKELGVTALYLNPVFESMSNHGYDTVDYERADHRFGTNRELNELVAELRGSGIRTTFDGVFNHSSPEFKPFKDVVENGATSLYRYWYFLSGFPVKVEEGQKTYRTFAGVPTMPKLNQDDPACRDYFLGIGEKWIREAGIAGWRLDVADEVSHAFWRAFRRRVKAANPEAYILGEAWGDAHEYLQGDEHDAVMNYRWRKAVLDFLAYRTMTAPDFDKALRRIREDYPNDVQYVMFNLLGSHDTERLRTIFRGDANREALAVVLQFTYPGVPSIYYGDEVGMEGGRDPDCRRCMQWDRSKWDLDAFGLYKNLIRLRGEKACLRRGAYRTLATTPSGLFRFERALGKERVHVAINNSDVPLEFGVSSRFKPLLGATAQQGRIVLQPLSFAVYSP